MAIIMPLREQIQGYVEYTERLIHEQQGWDRPGGLFTLKIGEDGKTLLIYEVPLNLGDEPALMIWQIAREMSADHPGTTEVLDLLATRNTIGFLLVYEKKLNIYTGGAVREFRTTDSPDAPRTRVVFGMDVLGRVYYVTRVEGEKPEVLPTDRMRLSGALPKGLRLLNMMLADRMADRDTYLAALAKVDIITSEEADGIRQTDPGIDLPDPFK